MAKTSRATDPVDARIAQWRRELPDLDTSPMQVLGRIHRIAHLATPAITEVFARHKLGRGEFDVVGTLLRAGPPYRLTPTELYRGLMISSGGLTDRLQRLERAKLIARDASPDDGRSLHVQLTARGRKVAEAAFRADMAREREMLAGLSKAERAQLATLLRKLAQHLE